MSNKYLPLTNKELSVEQINYFLTKIIFTIDSLKGDIAYADKHIRKVEFSKKTEEREKFLTKQIQYKTKCNDRLDRLILFENKIKNNCLTDSDVEELNNILLNYKLKLTIPHPLLGDMRLPVSYLGKVLIISVVAVIAIWIIQRLIK